jgi:hypothetical protein
LEPEIEQRRGISRLMRWSRALIERLLRIGEDAAAIVRVVARLLALLELALAAL